MVGVRRSKGCRICVQRRVKCDETRPSCNNCVKGGRPCPGYDPNILFRDEGPKLKENHARSNQKKRSSSPGRSTESSDHSCTNSPDDILLEYTVRLRNPPKHYQFSLEPNLWTTQSQDVSEATDETTECLGLVYTSPLNTQIHAPALAQKQLAHAFSESIAPNKRDFLPSVMKTQWAWLRNLPELTGTNALLDSAIRAVTLVHLGRQHRKDHLVKEALPHYGIALNLLRHTIGVPEVGLSNKTLCATALLSFYEMFASSDNASWIRHAGGVGALMRQRGPARHRYGLDREILRAYRYTLVIEAFEKGEPCFLHEPKWRKVLVDIHDDMRSGRMISDDKMVLFDAGEIFFVHTIEATDRCAQARKLPSLDPRSIVDQHHSYLAVLERLRRNRQALKDSHLLFEHGLIESGKRPILQIVNDPVFPMQYEYGSMFMSLFFMGYRSTLGIVNMHILGVIKPLIKHGILPPSETAEYIGEIRELSIKMCQSVPYMLRNSFLGPFYAIFGLRFAAQVFTRGEPEWVWVVKQLSDIADRHLLMARHLPSYDIDTGVKNEVEAERAVTNHA